MRHLAATTAFFLLACGARTGPELDRARSIDVDAATDAAIITDSPDVDVRALQDVGIDQIPRPPLLTQLVLFDRCDGAEQVAVRIDPESGARRRLFVIRGVYMAGPNALAASRDGRRFAWSGYESITGERGWRIYVQDGIAGTPQRLTWTGLQPDSATERPTWSPDGTQLAFELTLNGMVQTIGTAPAGPGRASIADTSGLAMARPEWSSDGAWLAATHQGDATPLRVFVMRTPVSGSRLEGIATSETPGPTAFTNEGRLATIERRGSSAPEIVLNPVPAGGDAVHIPLPAGSRVWAMARDPMGPRIALHLLPSRIAILDLRTRTLRTVYDPAGCTLVHNGLSWVLLPPG